MLTTPLSSQSLSLVQLTPPALHSDFTLLLWAVFCFLKLRCKDISPLQNLSRARKEAKLLSLGIESPMIPSTGESETGGSQI